MVASVHPGFFTCAHIGRRAQAPPWGIETLRRFDGHMQTHLHTRTCRHIVVETSEKMRAR
eukprot:15465320-Alexandrium_andersonii.AAC.1